MIEFRCHLGLVLLRESRGLVQATAGQVNMGTGDRTCACDHTSGDLDRQGIHFSSTQNCIQADIHSASTLPHIMTAACLCLCSPLPGPVASNPARAAAGSSPPNGISRAATRPASSAPGCCSPCTWTASLTTRARHMGITCALSRETMASSIIKVL